MESTSRKGSKKSWTVVKFIHENSVECVPTSWVIDATKCYWPPSHIDKSNAIKENFLIDEKTWEVHDIGMLRNNVYDNYNTARMKTKKAEWHSDLNSDSEKSHKRKIKPIVNTSSSEEENDSRFLRKAPVMKKITKDSSRKDEKRRNIRPEDSGSGESGEDDDSANDHSDGANNKAREHDQVVQTPKTPRFFEKTVESPSNITQHTSDQTEYLKQIVRKQNILQGMLSQVLDELAGMKLSNKKNDGGSVKSIFKDFNFPLNSTEEIEDFEKYLAIEENYVATVKELARMGGASPYDYVKRVLTALLSDSLAAMYSWLGAKKKRNFSKLKLSEILIASALRQGSNLGSNNMEVTSKKIEESAKNWLRRAKERSEGKQRRENARNQ